MLFAVFVSLGVCHGEADVCVVLFVEKKVDDWHIFMQWLDLDLELSSAFDGSCELGKRSVVAGLSKPWNPPACAVHLCRYHCLGTTMR